MQHEVSEFIVVAPAMLGRAVEWAEPRLLEFLGDQFPAYRFRIEPFGPLADDEEFTVIPIMNRRADPGEATEPDQLHMCRLDPAAVPQIEHALRNFDPDKIGRH